jgi:hypothetical protein
MPFTTPPEEPDSSELLESVAKFERLGDVVKKWNALFDNSKIPDLLYHYTNFDGLLGILGTNALRATFSQSLNDGSELLFGKSVVEKYPISAEVAADLKPPPEFRIDPPGTMFVTCFCEDPDLLSMWRCYSGQGGGFCLAFDGPSLNNGLQRDHLNVGDFAARLVKVYYGERPPDKMESLLTAGGHSTAQWVLENMIKHEGFAEEKEWRIIVPDPPESQMSFCSSHATIKAFVNIKNQFGDGKLPLKKILYGPTLRHDAALMKTLLWMTHRYGYAFTPIDHSKIPYRL